MTRHIDGIATAPASRRQVLAGLGAVGLAFAAPKMTRAAGGTLVVSNWGGDWNDRTVRFVEEPLVESQGIRIVRDLGMGSEQELLKIVR